MYKQVKKVLDSLGALASLILFTPVLLIIGVLVLTFDGRPVFFRQVRAGLDGKLFVIIKFRTMTDAIVVDDGDETVRVTKLGAALRKTSLDELPSLWNVVRGEMSFVGPRPLLTNYLDLYSEHHASRHTVKPGLTGLAQVSGRNQLSWKNKLDLDVEYVQRQSFWLDVGILFQTIFAVCRAQGITQENGSTMTPLREGYDAE